MVRVWWLVLAVECCRAFHSVPWIARSTVPRKPVHVLQLVAREDGGERQRTQRLQRRGVYAETLLGFGACGCTVCSTSVSFVADDSGDAAISYQDAAYEVAAAPFKRALLAHLLPAHHGTEPATIVEIGIGGFSTAAFYPRVAAPLHLIGIEPNADKHRLAMAAAKRCGLNLRVLTASAEALPLLDSSVDAVVTACTLCTVLDPRKALQEVRRVLKPGGRLLFWEHVLSETEPLLAARQIEATPQEVAVWGCHFDRRTLEEIKTAGFASVVGIGTDTSGDNLKCSCYFELPGLDLMGPTAVGIAIN